MENRHLILHQVGPTLLVEIVLLFFLAFLSAAEAAILAANRLRARHNAEHGSRGAKAVLELHAKKADFLPSILAAETLLTVLMSTLGTDLADFYFPGAKGLFLAVLLVTLGALTLGEILPKTLATLKPNRFSYFSAPAILGLSRFLSIVLRPITWTLGKLIAFIEHEPYQTVASEKELKYLISVSREHGIVQEEEEELLHNILDFTDAKAGEVMTPRTAVDSFQASTPIDRMLQRFTETGHRRYPIRDKDLDHIVGIIEIGDILMRMAEHKPIPPVKDLIKPAVFIPESKRVGELFSEMKEQGFRFAIVIDEYGGTAGIITMTNLLEKIVGALEKKTGRQIFPLDEKNLIVPSNAKLEEIEEKLGVSLDVKDYQTIGGLVFGLFGRVPNEGEQIRFQNLKFTVTQRDGYKIHQIMVTKEGP